MGFVDSDLCLCGSGLAYADCCARYHAGVAAAPSAEALMRSRFCAYARRDADYLSRTWDSAKRPASIDFSKEEVTWRRLEVLQCKKGGATDTKGLVEFKAYYEQAGQEFYLHELSRFVKAGAEWRYVDGVVKAVAKSNPATPAVASADKQGRNEPCACGSGKKFKHCCGS